MEYEVIRSSRRTIAAEIREGRLVIRAPLRAGDRFIREFVESKKDWIEKHLTEARERERKKADLPRLTAEEIRELAQKACAVIPGRVRHYAALVGVTYGSITIRNQKTRWGSCSSRGNLNFNCLLMLTPPEVIDSVVVHELCHRKEMNHSKAFYEEVLRVFPEYRKWNMWLKKNGAGLLARMPD